MTEAQDIKLRELATELREVARATGSMHAWWDTIFDIEAVLAGGRGILNYSAEQWISNAEALLQSHEKFCNTLNFQASKPGPIRGKTQAD